MTPADIDRVFGRSRLRMVTGDHVEVFREASAPGERRRYTKRFLATREGDFREWTEREWRILARLVGHGLRPVPEVVQFDRGAADRPALVQTYDAGVTVDHWSTLLPLERDGVLLRNVFEDCAHWWALARHTLIALDAIHELRLVHLDLKADNVCIPIGPADFDPAEAPAHVLRPRFDDIALIDFAFSLVSGESLRSALPIAAQPDYEYQSPRLLRALEAGRDGDLGPTRQLDWRCDFFSLAAMLWRHLPELDDVAGSPWTTARHRAASAFVSCLVEIHDVDLPQTRPHAELIARAAETLRQPDLRLSLQRGWTLAIDAAVAARSAPTPVTRIAPPVDGTAPAAVSLASLVTPVTPDSPVSLVSPLMQDPLVAPIMPAAAEAPSAAAITATPDASSTPTPMPAPPPTPTSMHAEPSDIASRAAARAQRERQRLRRRQRGWAVGLATAAAVVAAVPLLKGAWPGRSIEDVPRGTTVAQIDALPPSPAVPAAPPFVAAAATARDERPAGSPAIESLSATPTAAATPEQKAASVAPAASATTLHAEPPLDVPARDLRASDAPAGDAPVGDVPARDAPPRTEPTRSPPARVAPAPPLVAQASLPRDGARSGSRAVAVTPARPAVTTPPAASTRAAPRPAATSPTREERIARARVDAEAQARAQSQRAAPSPSSRVVTPPSRPSLDVATPAGNSGAATAWAVAGQVPSPRSSAPMLTAPTLPAPASPAPGPDLSPSVAPAPTVAPSAGPRFAADEATPTEAVAADYAARAERLMTDLVPRLAQRAERMVSRALFVAGRSENVVGDAEVSASVTALGRGSIDVPGMVIAPRAAQGLHEAARSEFARRGATAQAVLLQVRAFGANPVEPSGPGYLAFLLLRQRPANAEAARQLALVALLMHGQRHPLGRAEDWATLAVADALLGRQRDAANAMLMSLAAAPNPERQCRAALDTYAVYGQRVRAPVEALLRAANAASARPAALCTWPPYWVESAGLAEDPARR